MCKNIAYLQNSYSRSNLEMNANRGRKNSELKIKFKIVLFRLLVIDE